MATQLQATVSGALQALNLEVVENGMPGSPQSHKVTDATIKYLQGPRDAGTEVVVDSDGNVSV